MRLLSLIFMKVETGKAPVMLASAFYLDYFSIFERSTVQEACTFVTREILRRTQRGTVSSLKHQKYMCHVRVTNEGLGIVVVCDEEYPRIAAFGCIQQGAQLFLDAAGDQWKSAIKDVRIPVNGVNPLLAKFQDPTEADKVLKIRKELEEIKAICLDSLDRLLERDEKLQQLIDSSTDLSFATKAFADKSGDLNRCCTLFG